MPSNINVDVDRVLTSEEVRQLLLEEAKEEDREIAQIMKRWRQGLKQCRLAKEVCAGATDEMIRVTAWKEEQTYIFEALGKQIGKQSLFYARTYGRCGVTEICYLTKMPTRAQMEGISISEIEEISDKFFVVATPIKCLLDAGFTLELIVPRAFLGL